MVQCCICWKEHSPLLPRQFHSFPKDAERREKWCSSIGYIVNAYKNARICSDHFTDDDYSNSGTPIRSRRLNKTAIPSVFMQSSETVHKDSTNNSDNQHANEVQMNVEHSTMNIQHQATMDVEQQSTADIQQSTTYVEERNVIAKSISANNNGISRKSKPRDTSNMDKLYIKSGKTNVECIRKTDFVNNEAWLKFMKCVKYNRYLHKTSMVQKSRTQKKLVTMGSVLQALESKKLVTYDIKSALKVSN
ncbi:PREDICTED: uncharacterized protein LOC105555756 [Vollenhovia emeryi]|uniref:uncharacterized protein LOC105555756 n=1 Tax=Vollenhovia emeryi TaxID=411798 RepID=UPI0005F3A87C|nr:PREDICTED: uncharacterized protein LOC105555756 [Vollenhovia emeryi]